MVYDTQFLFVVIEVVACDAEALGCLFPHIYFIAADADNEPGKIIAKFGRSIAATSNTVIKDLTRFFIKKPPKYLL